MFALCRKWPLIAPLLVVVVTLSLPAGATPPDGPTLIRDAIQLAANPRARAADIARARQLVQRSRSGGLSAGAIQGLARSLERAYQQAPNLQRCHAALQQAGVIERVKELGFDAGRRREKGILGAAIKEPLPALCYRPAEIKTHLKTAGGGLEPAPVTTLDVGRLYHWRRTVRSARRVLRQQAFSISNVPNEGGRGVFAGPEPRYWRVMGDVLLRIEFEPRGVRMFDMSDDASRHFFLRWRDQQASGRPDQMDRFCREFGIDVLKQGEGEYLIKSARAIKAIRWARSPRELALQLGGPLEKAAHRINSGLFPLRWKVGRALDAVRQAAARLGSPGSAGQ